MKFIKNIFKWLVGILVILVFASYIFDYDYILKGIRVVYFTGHSTAFIDDYPYFENDTIKKGPTTDTWPLHKKYNSKDATDRLQVLNEKYGTIAYLIIKNDSIFYEKYAEDYSKDSKTNSFSMAKSITSALLGKAIMDGYIKNLDQPISDFFPEFEGTKTTVGDLSSMSSGLDWVESYTSPFSITARANYDDDLAATILNLKVVKTPGKEFEYLSGSTQLLGMVIKKATKKPLADYLSESFWKPLGAQSDALWQLDDDENKLAKAFCCISSNARDFARFGKLYKDHGKWNGKQILDSTFVAKSTQSRFKGEPYGYGFWVSNYNNKHTFAMIGILGQYVITIPEDNIIIVRLGHHRSPEKVNFFPSDFYVYIDEAYAMLKK
ncbi:serine hydrolase domain-containing protein [Winogradskyella sediminis]|uniref:CubicO group peptidase, beta-lactamase class C family n=1 Tax=Winogradskyella sediminis TaxID=1382466 RepID=A0A1H1SEK5_9FLAO|nr:serine hydrolase [Winogradskyella sediminis]SDS46372.1 CubicO group peptidase, beta-lactamase class C family [Winogradskyella sediminis]